VNKQQVYNRIAQATIKALREQAETGKVNQFSTDAVYKAIDAAFTKEYASLLENNQALKTALECIAAGQDLTQEQMVALAQQTLSSTHQ